MADADSGLLPMVGRFFAWWGGELAGLIPAPLREVLVRKPPLRVLEFSATEVRVVEHTRKHIDELGRFTVAEIVDEPDPTAVAAAQSLARKGGASAVILPPDQALFKTMTLPIMAPADLRDALAFQIDRQTPFSPDDVYFAYHVRERDSETKRLSIDLLVAPRTVVDRVVAVARSLRFEPQAVGVSGLAAGDPFALNLLPRSMMRRRRNYRPIAALVVVAALTFGVWSVMQAALESKEADAQALTERVDLARQRADKVQALKDERDGLVRQSEFLQKRKAVAPKPVIFLEELSRVLPDHTWLFHLQQDGMQLRLSGYTSDASALIGLVGDLPMFTDPKFGSPVTNDPRRNKDRFNLVVEIAPPVDAETASGAGTSQ